MTDVENDLMPRGDLLAKARGMAARWRGMASETKTSAFRDTWLGSALLIEELVRYAEDRDKEIARLVREAALLRARLEERESAVTASSIDGRRLARRPRVDDEEEDEWLLLMMM